jgi:hypothetical protein
VECDLDRTGHLNLVLLLRLASYLLGVAVIVDAIVAHAEVVQWVAGLVLVGIIPPEAVVRLARRGRG